MSYKRGRYQNIIIITIMSSCLNCSLEVRDRQQKLQCKTCNRLQHRICTDITQEEFRHATKEHLTIEWTCRLCLLQEVVRDPSTSFHIGHSFNDTSDMPNLTLIDYIEHDNSVSTFSPIPDLQPINQSIVSQSIDDSQSTVNQSTIEESSFNATCSFNIPVDIDENSSTENPQPLSPEHIARTFDYLNGLVRDDDTKIKEVMRYIRPVDRWPSVRSIFLERFLV